MRVNMQIRTKHEGVDTVSAYGEYMETERAHVISYIESLYDNLIVIDKETGIVTVEKQSTVSNQQYYSKLVFELGCKHKCSVEVDGYNTFINIDTKSMRVVKTEKQLTVVLDYIIEDTPNYVEIVIEW